MKKRFFRITTLVAYPTEIEADFDDPEQATAWVALNENAKIQSGEKSPSIPYFITEYEDYEEKRVWLSQDGLIPGLKAKTWYLIHKETDAMGYEITAYEEEGGDGPSD
ncbi:hypothetical protein J6S46_00095 [Candidatus Saccharibacteria bacterium]|nr:hypothetical protein [Candidatus Saccharibacteria bacterium]